MRQVLFNVARPRSRNSDWESRAGRGRSGRPAHNGGESLFHVAPSGGIPSNEVTPGTLLIRPLFAPCFFLFSVRSLSAGFYSVPRSPGISQIGGENEGISDASPSGSRCGKNSADFPEFFPNFFFEDARGSRNQGGGGGQDGRPTMARRRREAGGQAATGSPERDSG